MGHFFSIDLGLLISGRTSTVLNIQTAAPASSVQMGTSNYKHFQHNLLVLAFSSGIVGRKNILQRLVSFNAWQITFARWSSSSLPSSWPESLVLLLNKLETAITILLRRVPPIPLINNSEENGIFGPTTLILALLDRFMANIFGDFPLRGGGGYPPFPLNFFWQSDFPLRGWRREGVGTPLVEKIRLVIFCGFPNKCPSKGQKFYSKYSR